MDAYEVPEKAILSFEKLNDLTVVVHDFVGRLWPFLSPNRHAHHAPLCAAVKSTAYEPRCVAFEIDRLRPELEQIGEGRIHVCHAGLVEWVAPIWGPSEAIGVLFAGQRQPGRTLRPSERDDRTQVLERLRVRNLPSVVEQDEAEALQEALIQLSARLASWMDQQSARKVRRTVKALSISARRRQLIHRFVQNHHKEIVGISDLARSLHLSESRAAHVVRELFGTTLNGLLVDARLRSAAALLRHTSLSVSEITLRCGVTEISHFHRAFRKAMGVSPGKYRKMTQT